MKKLLPFLLLAFFFAPYSYAEPTQADIAGALPKVLKHPYLLFDDTEKPAILSQIQTDPESRDIMARLLAEANRLLYTPVDPMPPQPLNKGAQLFDNTGDGGYLSQYYAYRTNAYNLAFVYQMTGDKRYAEKAFQFAKEVCDMPTWVFRAHQFPIVYGRVMPWNVPDDQTVFTYEIVTSDTAAMLAVAYDWLYPTLTREQRDWMRSGLLSHAITRVRGNWEFHWWATAYRCNWCAWCCNGLGLAALTLLTENPQLVDMVTECHNRIYRTFSETGDDGDWAEGGSYWSHTFNKPMVFNAALAHLTGGKYNLFRHPKIAGNPVNLPLWYQIPPDRRINFADSGDDGLLGSRQLINKIVIETGNPEAAWLLDNKYGKSSDILDILWPAASVKGKLPMQASKLFKTTGIAILRSEFTDPEKVTVACKAGHNDDPHHGHLDVGQFMVYWRGEAFIRDLGTAEYDELYFGPKKYDTPHAASIGHNLIFVNGERQICGKLKDQPFNPEIGGEILEYRPGESRDYVLMDPTKAYPGKELLGWRRHVILEKPVITVILDEVKSKPGAEIEARFHSEGTQTPKDGYTLISGKKGTMALIPVVDGAFSFRPGRHAYEAVFKQSDLEWIPYNGTVVKASGEKTLLAHVILPVQDDAEAKKITASVRRSFDGAGNLTVSFEKAGKKYSYVFGKSGEGLVLK